MTRPPKRRPPKGAGQDGVLPGALHPQLCAKTLAQYDVDTAVQLILCREKFIVKEMYKYLDYQDTLNIRRRELLYRKWSLRVRDPLQQKILEKVYASHGIMKRKREESASYIRYSNKMGNAFFDHYDPEQYDPFYMRNKDPDYLQVTLPPFHDPLLQAQQARDEENRAILQCETGKIYTMKEFKEVEKAKQLTGLLPFSFAQQDSRLNSGPAERAIPQKSSARAKLGSAGRSRPPSMKYFPILTFRPEDTREKVVGSVLGISGLTSMAWSTADQDEVRSTRASSRAAEVWAHRPAPLRSVIRPASQKLRHTYQEKLSRIPCMGQVSRTP